MVAGSEPIYIYLLEVFPSLQTSIFTSPEFLDVVERMGIAQNHRQTQFCYFGQNMTPNTILLLWTKYETNWSKLLKRRLLVQGLGLLISMQCLTQ
jgi:hypothetical protein